MAEKTAEELAAEAAAAAAAEAAKVAKTKTVKVRVLSDQGEYACNSVVALTPADAKAAVAEGWADDDAAAVKYAEAESAAQASA
jgi:hypothetical protein